MPFINKITTHPCVGNQPLAIYVFNGWFVHLLRAYTKRNTGQPTLAAVSGTARMMPQKSKFVVSLLFFDWQSKIRHV